MEFSKRFKIEEVWPEELIAKKPEYRGKTLFDVLYKNGQVDKFPVSDIEAGYVNDESKAFGFYVQKGLFEEYAEFGRGHGHDLAPFDTYHQVRGLRWPVVNGQETDGASARARSLCEAGQGRAVLRLSRTARRASSRCPTSRRRNPPTANIRSGSRPAACWSTGIPAP